ncbi:MAG: amino acid adenylation domain-containing protein [Candidatus Angelobacter sp.]
MKTQFAPGTLGTLLMQRAQQHPRMQVYRWLANGSQKGASLTFAELDRRARVIATKLQSCTVPGARAILLYRPGLNFIEALFGCFYAGVIAVPAYVPASRRDHPRIEILLRDAGCSTALTTADSLETVAALTRDACDNVICVATDAIEENGLEWVNRDTGRNEIAYLQYTSGSTSAPKGVIVTHGNVLANLHSIASHGDFGESAVSVNWLPHFHDMGLIYGILQPLYSRFPAILLSPAAFIHRPLRWLSAISEYRGTHCGGPNFAYDLCVERINADERSLLDLTSWRVAFSGAEPVRNETLERFASCFSGCGFSRKAFYPVYGLAEATLKATSGEPGTGAKVCLVDPEKLAQNKLEIADKAAASPHKLVSCGSTSDDHEVAIVDPDSLALCTKGQVGEIWFSGPSVAAGYWNNPAETEKTFHAYLKNGKGPYLRTGDLGFLHAGDLFVTGRLKDCIIVRGRNLYPQDIEKTVEESHPAARRNGCAAFPVEDAGRERVVLVVEVARKYRENLDGIMEEVRRSVAEGYEIHLHTVVLIQAGSLPRTSSGKIQRRECKRRFLAGELAVLAQAILQQSELADSGARIDREMVLNQDSADRQAYIEDYLGQLLAHMLRLPLDQAPKSQSLVSLGIDSLSGFELLARLESDFSVAMPLNGLLDENIAGIASRILEAVETTREQDSRPRLERLPRPLLAPLAPSQQQVWFLQQLHPESCAYNEHLGVQLRGNVEVEILREAINEIVRRHEILRTNFISIEGVPHQSVQPVPAIDLPLIDVADCRKSGEDIQTLVARETQRPFHLDRQLPIRFLLVKEDANAFFLLMVAHHIVCDGSSLSIVVHELGTLYDAYQKRDESPLADLNIQYSDYSVWRRACLQGETLERDLAYWRQQLAGMHILDLPADHPRPVVAGHRGGMIPIDLPASLSEDMKRLGRREGVTPFVSLLAPFQVVLSKYAGQTDVTVGTVIANRGLAEIRNLIGFFVNTLVLRTDLSGNPTFLEVLGRARKVALDAYEHQHVPFERLVEELQPERDLSRSPLFQVMLVFQPQLIDEKEFGGVKFSFPEVDAGISKFDLTLRVIDAGTQMRACIEYNQEIFDPSTIQRMAEHLRVGLERMVEQPQQRIGELSLLTVDEREQLLADWNRREIDHPPLCIHELFARQAAITPEAVAVECDGQELSYRDLNLRANQVGHYLRKLGVGAEVRVGICVERNLEMVIGLLGILKAGGAYVPLDPAYPRERLQFMIKDAQVSVLVTQNRFRELFPSMSSGKQVFLEDERDEIAAEAGTDIGIEPAPENLAYVIYTSGSTGKPKGVAIVHHGASVLIHWATQVFGKHDLSGVLASTSICFDLSVFEIFVPLSVGGRVIVASNALALPQWLKDGKVSLVNTVPSAMAELVRMKGIPSSVRVVNLAGEALQRNLVEQIYDGSSVESVFNLYGPSEDTTYSTYVRLKRGEATLPVSIGRPIANTQAYVLDDHYQLLPIGIPGELYLAGAGLARGYLNRPGLTGEKFVPNPFSQKPGDRLYRTGDRARWLVDGNLDFLGRRDHQVKLRGFRIELAEIEAALLEHPMVEQALAVVREDQPGEKRLVAYVISRGQTAKANTAELRDHLRVRLPEYMVPGAIMAMREFPLTPNGKVNRAALPKPDWQDAAGQDKLSPCYPEEEILCGIFSEVLKLEQVGVEQDFFNLGGHSLLATQVVSRVRNALGVDLPLRVLFEAPTARGLAQQVKRSRSEEQVLSVPLLPAARTGHLPLSYAQQRLWFLDQLDPGSAIYNMPFEMHLRGQLDQDALQRSLNKIVERHEALRTSFVVRDGIPWQQIAEEQQISVELIDLSMLPQNECAVMAQELAGIEASRTFDLSKGPLLRVKLLRFDDQEHLLLLTMHHIVSDGWSIGIMVREFSRLYEGYVECIEPELPQLEIQYADYALWQREWLNTQIIEKQLAYWKRQLADVAVLELPTKKPGQLTIDNHAENEVVRIPSAITEKLKELNRRESVTLFMSLLTAFSVTLSGFSGQKDLVLGTPVANRERTEVEGLIGLFVNTLVLRNDLTGNPSFRTLLRRTRETVLDAHSHQDVPFEKLVEELAPDRDLGKAPLFQVMVSMQNTEIEELQLPGLQVSGFASRAPMAKFDLLLLLSESGGSIVGDLSYRSGLYEVSTMHRLMRHWSSVLEQMVVEIDMAIGDVPLLSESESRQLLVEWNPAATPYPSRCLHELFEEQAMRTPAEIALKCGQKALSYAELNRRANRIGQYLRKLGVGPEIPVGICMDRGLEMVTGLLGILKAGGCYVPLDPAYPPERLNLMLEDAQAPVLLTQSSLADRVDPAHSRVVCVDEEWQRIAAENCGDISAPVTPENLAYVIYTSGSTGKPKGVAIQHRSAAALLYWGRETFSAAELAGVLASTSICFDLSVFEIFQPLSVGGKVIVTSNALSLPQFTGSDEVTLVNTVPSAMRELIRMKGVPASVKTVNLAGEALQESLVRQIYELESVERVVNLYGPSEDTTYSTYVAIQRGEGELVTIGKPIANTQAYVLDEEMRAVPIGVPGELWLGGEGLARGYLRRPELTAERFVPDPFSERVGARAYRTGDQVRWRPDGNLEFLGRLDHQVKLRGYRIELGEIEAALLDLAHVEQAVVVARGGEETDKKLVAYLVFKDRRNQTNVNELRAHLRARLPEYMVPSAFVLLDELPLTPNGKLNRKALPEPEDSEKEYVAPITPVEKTLAAIWSDVLKVKRPGIRDNFFEVGGHSLLAVQLISRVRELLHVELPVRQLFERPTIESVAQYIETLQQVGEDSSELVPVSRDAYRLWPASDSSVEQPDYPKVN